MVQNKTPVLIGAPDVDGVIDDWLTVVMPAFRLITNYPFYLEESSRYVLIKSSDKHLLIYPTPDSTPQEL